ncbi:hypothetical protein [Acidocella sp.]|uniref:hypothetical protein n=1 Tax=Acidocella sp. TaxID=50710 RepID=UPI002632A2BD|nr:hypothetical protein [Acidocella sp.]MDD2796336.1 hypothetical protein [Acidocella sp.]
MKPPIGRDTKLCMSLSARPGNFSPRFQNHLYEAPRLDSVYKSFTTQNLPAAIGGIRALSIRGGTISMPFKEAVIPPIDTLEAPVAPFLINTSPLGMAGADEAVLAFTPAQISAAAFARTG